jgi:hypothetical protein
VDEQFSVVVFHAFAIRLARMIDPPSAIASRRRVDDGAIAQLEQECVMGIFRIANRLNIGVASANASPAIFDDLGPLANGAGRKYPTAVNRRRANTPARTVLQGCRD